MGGISFTPRQREQLVEEIRTYVTIELDREIGDFAAALLLDFFTEKVGPLYYNEGLLDARAAFEARVESIGEVIHELERATPFER